MITSLLLLQFAVLASSPLGSPAVASSGQALVREAGADADLRWRDDSTLRSLRVTPASRLARFASDQPADQRAAALFQTYANALGLSDPDRELVLDSERADGIGGRLLHYAQRARGVEVFGGGLRLRFDRSGNLRALHSAVVPDMDVDAQPRFAASHAAEVAHRWRLAKLASSVPTEESVDGPYAFRTNRARGIPGRDHLVYRVDLRDAGGFRAFVFVDAHTGKVVEVHPGVYDGLSRRVFNGATGTENLIWEEGFPLGTAPADAWADIGKLLDDSADAYNFFWHLSAHTFDSYDNQSGLMDIVYAPPTDTYACPNASWQGDAAYFCPGVTSDDIVVHEWAHAYTDSTHQLVYMWQPGALNEAYSDIYGETADLINARDVDAPAPPRGDGLCSQLIGEGWPVMRIEAPAQLAQVAELGHADFGPQPSAVLPISGSLVLVDDGTGDAADTCQPIVNTAAISGHVALIRRGDCLFAEKVLAAQTAGAIAVLVFNHEGDELVTMSGDGPEVVIPSFFVGQTLGELLAAEPAATVAVTFELSVPGGDDAEASYRWLIGEGATAFDRALRDMWSPTCLGAPGKVSDDEFACTRDDVGGVHTNSGVPNHAFTLLVDGGAYNGETVLGIGLTKASQIYWRAMLLYQQPYTQFADHADALDAACADLVGVDVPSLTTGLASGEVMTTADCAQVAAALRAVEMRSFPSQCDYTPILAKAPPSLCASTGELFADDFEQDRGWSVEHLAMTADFVDREWLRVSSLPGGREGSAYYGATPDLGNCDDDDQSGVLYLTSPAMHVDGDLEQPVVVFEHYVATESDYDGGNLQVSVNGGPWQLVASSSFLYNEYNASLVPAAGGNSDPLAGQSAFSGTDDGGFVGSWGESQIDLSDYVSSGDDFRLRFALGTDGCTGYDGWYVDNLRVIACAVASPGNDSGGCGGCSSAGGGGLWLGLVILAPLVRRQRRAARVR